MIYKSSLNHKGNRATFKDFFGCSIIVFEVCGDFPFPSFNPPYFGGSHLNHFFIFFNDSTFCGAQVVGLQFLFGHKIQRSTLQKFVDF
jgi:hypothetical protein